MYVELGKLVGVWGVKGWLKLHSYTRNREDIASYKTWWLKKGHNETPSPVQILNCRVQGQGIVAQVDGVNDRDQANMLIGAKIFVPESELPSLKQGEFYWQQLIGLKVVSSTEGEDANLKIGTVASMLETGANDVFVVKPDTLDGESTGPEVLIPYIESVVLSIDLESGTMLVDWDPTYLAE